MFASPSRAHRSALLRVVPLGVAAGVLLLVAAAGSGGRAAGPVELLVNGGFETGRSTTGCWGDLFLDSAVPGWDTNDSQDEIEIWSTDSGNCAGFSTGAPQTAFAGTYWIEANANSVSAVWQEIATVPGDRLLWKVAHRARGNAATDTGQVLFGPGCGVEGFVGLSPVVPLEYNAVDTGRDPDSGSPILSDGSGAWGVWSGVYEVPAGQYVTRVAFQALTSDAPGIGNFIDGFSVKGTDPGYDGDPCQQPSPLPPTPTPAPTPVPSPALGLTKETGVDFAPVPGTTIDYTLTISNEGNVPLPGPFTLDDPLTADETCEAIDAVGDEDALLDVGETIDCTATYTVGEADVAQGYVDNTATACADTICADATLRVRAAPTILVVIDRSRSVAREAGWIRRAYNEQLAGWQRRWTSAPYSLVVFNSERYRDRLVDVPIGQVRPMPKHVLRPRGLSPLYDGVARAVAELRARGPIGRVTVIVYSDGYDTASTKETQASLARLIAQTRRTLGWQFSFVGPNLTALQAAVEAEVAAGA